MADRGRDLTLKVVSDTSQVDLSDVAEQLDDIETASADAEKDLSKVTDELKRVAAQGKDAERELSRLDKELKANQFDEYGKDASQAAKEVDAAFDRIGRSARRVDDETDKAKRGLDEFGDEAKSTSKEAAASFSGVESALDAVQEIAANAFAGFGPAGLAAGALAAAGIGLVFSGLQSSADKANEAKDRVIELAGAIRDAGGAMSEVDFVGLMRDWSDAIVDNKSWWEVWQKDNTSNFEKIIALAERAGISFDDMFDAMTGNDPQALERTLDQITRGLEENNRARKEAAALAGEDVTASRRRLDLLDQERDALLDSRQAIKDKTGETEDAIKRAAEFARVENEQAEATAALASRMQDAADATAEFAAGNKAAAQSVATSSDDMATAVEAAAQRMADASPEKDTWSDWRDTAVASINDVIAAQERDIQASIDFQKNAEEVYAAVGQAGVDWANAQGENADKAMQMLADAPKEKQGEIVNNYVRLGLLQSEGVGDGMVNGKPAVTSAASQVHAAAKRQLDKEIGIPVRIDSGGVSGDAAALHRQLERNFANNPVSIPVVVRRTSERRVP